MKKILSTVVALGLAVGAASTASALEFKVSGHYFVEGVYMSSGDGDGLVLNDDKQGNNSYWRHEFKIRPMIKVNDKIVMKSVIYLANSDIATDGSDGIWGTQDDGNKANDNEINVQQLFMEYMSPYGKLRVGRTSVGLWQGDFLSSDVHGNRLMFFPNFLGENIGGCVFLQKTTEGDKYTTDVDGDSDVYEVAVWYKKPGMIASLGFDYIRDANFSNTPPPGLAYTGQKGTINRFKGYYNQNFTNVYAEVEFQYHTGDFEVDSSVDIGAGVGQDVDVESLGFMADLGVYQGKLDVGMMFIYGSGDSDGRADGDKEDLGQLGEQFQPYNILTGANTGMMVTDVNGANGAMTQAGIISLGLHASYAVSDVLSVNSALAYAQAESEQIGWEDEYGWEIDLGMTYSLMANLAYQVDFGYLMTGDFFEEGVAGADTEDVYTLTHRLTMEF